MERNIEKELCYFTYTDMEDGNDEERIHKFREGNRDIFSIAEECVNI